MPPLGCDCPHFITIKAPMIQKDKMFSIPNDHVLRTMQAFLAICLSGLLLLGLTGPLHAQTGITFQNVAEGGGAGLLYQRTPSTTEAIFDPIKQQPTVTMADFVQKPIKSRGAPGEALWDYDRDGDLDVYVTNGPGTNNSLFASQLQETGQVSFVDVAGAAGVAAKEQDSNGVCFGDIDNDGDVDLRVLGRAEPNRLFENLGNGAFADITASSGIDGGNRTSVSCTLGDVNGDGLLDILVGNAFDMISAAAIFTEPYALNEHNQLFLNNGNRTFTDVSATAGVETLHGFPPGAASINFSSLTFFLTILKFRVSSITQHCLKFRYS